MARLKWHRSRTRSAHRPQSSSRPRGRARSRARSALPLEKPVPARGTRSRQGDPFGRSRELRARGDPLPKNRRRASKRGPKSTAHIHTDERVPPNPTPPPPPPWDPFPVLRVPWPPGGDPIIFSVSRPPAWSVRYPPWASTPGPWCATPGRAPAPRRRAPGRWRCGLARLPPVDGPLPD